MQQSLPSILRGLALNQPYRSTILRQGNLYGADDRIDFLSGECLTGLTDGFRLMCMLAKIGG